MTRVVILGAAGRMGRALIRCSQRIEGITLAAAVDKSGSPQVGQDAGVVSGISELGVPITDSLATAMAVADVAIDFTFHEAVPDNLGIVAEAGKAMVIGTTGLNKDEEAQVRAYAETTPVVWAPNMSLGVNLLFALVQKASSMLDLEYDAEIVETHHRYKQDAPSGTALGLARSVAAGRNQNLDDVLVHGREGITGERTKGEIGMHALRSGDVVGDHTVSFATEGERVEFTHKASSRDAFANGALRASAWLNGRDAGLYDMQDVLGLK